MGINTKLAFSPNNVVETLISAFWTANSHPSWHNFNKPPIYTKLFDGYGYEIYLHVISHAAAYDRIADQVERAVTLQECFPLTK